jgi:O-methyltransferase involved in polyketide biosynthesis
VLARAIDAGATQVVILGAGFDTRAYRLTDLLKDAKIFEVDRPQTQQVNRRRPRYPAVGQQSRQRQATKTRNHEAEKRL